VVGEDWVSGSRTRWDGLLVFGLPQDRVPLNPPLEHRLKIFLDMKKRPDRERTYRFRILPQPQILHNLLLSNRPIFL
jgi:hypothetical protein